ncbi:hypothetical protein [Endobacterium cereale]|uniref:hypothetical protein n=1 Tax=Endobacterium cereale TaxID=2663029 RepID=UPI002B460DD9|nr:hypothetical protein [Endobacterium cereale]MEB2845882.1 hypothetical protein [Endobacterium cereale]
MAASDRNRITITPIQQIQLDTHRDISQAVTFVLVVVALAFAIGFQLAEWDRAMELARI